MGGAEEAKMFRAGLLGRARGSAEDPGRLDSGDEDSVVGDITREERLEHDLVGR